MKVVWNTETGENIEFFDNYDDAMEFIRKENNPKYKITSCD